MTCGFKKIVWISEGTAHFQLKLGKWKLDTEQNIDSGLSLASKSIEYGWFKIFFLCTSVF